jgi:hypothetical protein
MSFPGSTSYWRQRYEEGGNCGPGAFGRLGKFKNEIINRFVAENAVQSVIEFGCGDGYQLRHALYPQYRGFDVSEVALNACRRIFAGDPSKSFALMDEYKGEKAELALSLDVIFHLVEDDVFERYMQLLFAAAERYVIVYSSNSDTNTGQEGNHVYHRTCTRWIEEYADGWALLEHIPNPFPYRGDFINESFSDFFIYAKSSY